MIDELYKAACEDKESDIYFHLPKLKEYATKCSHVTELGTRKGNSTLAFLSARSEIVISYDLDKWDDIFILEDWAKKENINYEFIQANDLEIEIEPTDLLFIDTLHTGEQLFKELFLHADKANKYLIFHDTVTYWDKGMWGGSGMGWAITEFIQNNPEWKEVYRSEENNGLLILERK